MKIELVLEVESGDGEGGVPLDVAFARRLGEIIVNKMNDQGGLKWTIAEIREMPTSGLHARRSTGRIPAPRVREGRR